MPIVKFLPSEKEVTSRSGESLLDIALDHQVSIQHACGGFCACTTCHCEVLDGESSLSPIDEDEAERLSVLENKTPRSRLACQAKVNGNVTVRIYNAD